MASKREPLPDPRVIDLESRKPYIETESRGGPGGGGNMLEARVARLEEDVKELRVDMKAVRSDIAEIKGKVSMLPGYGGIALVVGVIVGLSTLAQVAAKFLPSLPPSP